jgi:hypothetical protein
MLQETKYQELMPDPFYDLATCIKGVDNPVVVIPLGTVFDEGIVDEVERIDRLKKVVFLTDFQLLHISLRSVKENPVHEAIGPEHLHLNDELAFFLIHAANIHDAVSCLRDFGDQLAGKILKFLDLGVRFKRQQRVKKALEEVRMLTKNLLKGQVVFWIQVAHAGHHIHWL